AYCLRMPCSVGLLVQLSDGAGHFQACDQLSIARFPAHPRFSRAMSLVSGVEASPYFHQLIADLLLSVEAIFFRPRALLSEALADLFQIYNGDAVGHRHRGPCADPRHRDIYGRTPHT